MAKTTRPPVGINPNVPIAVQRELRKVAQFAFDAQDRADQALSGLTTKVSKNLTDLLDVSKFVSSQVQAGGQFPINLGSLTGQAGQNQLAYVPSVSSLPNRNSPLAVDGQAVWYKNLLWRYSLTGGGTSSSSVQPGTWQSSSPILVGTHAQRLALSPSDYPDFEFFETDRALIYISNGTSWLYAAGGPGYGSFETRWSDLVATDVGIEWLESSRSTINNQAPFPLYRWSGTAWVFVSGLFFRTQAQIATLAATLTVNDFSAQVFVSVYDHQLAWSGSGWVWGTQETGAHPIEGMLVDPVSGYALCDGSTTTYLNSDGTTTSVTLPNLTGSAAGAAYLKLGSPDSGPNPAVAPGASVSGGSVASNTTGVSNQTALTNVGVNAHSYLNQNVQSGSGTTIVEFFNDAATSHTVSDPGHSHLVTDPGHTHTLSSVSVTVDATGEPRNLVLRPWFRR